MSRDIHIKPVLNGFVVDIGCQSVVFNNINFMAEEIARYYKDPAKVQKEYMERGINKVGPLTDIARGPEPAQEYRGVDMARGESVSVDPKPYPTDLAGAVNAARNELRGAAADAAQESRR